MRTPPALLALALPLALPCAASAQLDAWAEGQNAIDDGATRDFYNRGAGLRWRQQLGDWTDRDGALHGDAAWATTTIEDTDTERWIEWDVTDLVAAWLDGSVPEYGFYLRGGTFIFSSREGATPPELVVDGVTLEPTADTYLEASTFQQMGESEELRAGRALLRFDLSGVTEMSRATLRLYTLRQFGSGDVEVFSVVTGVAAPAPEAGLAAGYERDEGIASHPDVVFAEGYEADDWMSGWTAHGGVFDVAEPDDSAFGFAPISGRALRVVIPEGEHTALNSHYDFMDELGEEPEEIYFRYYLRLGDDWDQTVDGGKMPGISGTYGRAGWGGRRSDGSNGWSARGAFSRTVPDGNPLAGRTALGHYVYHAAMEGRFGDNFSWVESWGPEGRGGLLEPGRWVCVDMHVRLNTPGASDGVLRAWIDGVPSMERTDMRFRDVGTLRIERIWMNIYHGGTAPSPHDQHAFIDHVVVARSYIGPMGGLTPEPPVDGGVPPTEDAGPPTGDDAATPTRDGGASPDGGAGETSSGCGCRIGGRGRPGLGALLLLSLAALWRRRRAA